MKKFVKKYNKNQIEKLNEKLSEIQERAKSRTISIENAEYDINLALQNGNGVYRINGGFVCNSYKYRAESTYIIFAVRGEMIRIVSVYRGRAQSRPRGNGPELAKKTKTQWRGI